MKTAILLSVLLTSCYPAYAQERYLELDDNVAMVLTDEPCGEASLRFAYAVELNLLEVAHGCWFEQDAEVYIRMRNGEKYQDYRFLNSSFKAIK